jgi:hypothetical protein
MVIRGDGDGVTPVGMDITAATVTVVPATDTDIEAATRVRELPRTVDALDSELAIAGPLAITGTVAVLATTASTARQDITGSVVVPATVAPTTPAAWVAVIAAAA